MKTRKMTARLLAFLTAFGILCTTGGMTSFAGATGLGAASFEDHERGPGVTVQEEGKQEQTGSGQEAAQQEQTGTGQETGQQEQAQTAQEQAGEPLQINYYG